MNLRKKFQLFKREKLSLIESQLRKKGQRQEMTLLKNLNPIKRIYERKKIRMVIDKKSLLLADDKLDITKDVMSLLNKKLK